MYNLYITYIHIYLLLLTRFLKGAVDSEDLLLSLSREKPQNSNLLRRIRDVLTRKFLRFLSDEAKNNPESYREFYLEYHMFLKEGLCQDYAFMEQLSKLLLFESSAVEHGKVKKYSMLVYIYCDFSVNIVFILMYNEVHVYYIN